MDTHTHTCTHTYTHTHTHTTLCTCGETGDILEEETSAKLGKYQTQELNWTKQGAWWGMKVDLG